MAVEQQNDPSFYREHLQWLRTVNQQAKEGLLPSSVLAAYQRAFIITLWGPLGLSVQDQHFLGRLALASAQEPVPATEAMVVHISRLNEILPERVGLRVRRAVDEQGQETGFYLGPRSEIVLSERESQIMSLLAAGFTAGEIALQLNHAQSTIKNSLSGLYSRLHVHGGLGAALLLVEDDVLNAQPLRDRYDLRGFRSLSRRQRDVLDTLITVGDLGNSVMADKLKLSPASVKLYLSNSARKISADNPPSRVALGVGYWLYQQAQAASPENMLS